MSQSRYPIVLGACAVTLITGCAQTGVRPDAHGIKVAPVYRVQQPAGTAAGQYAVGRIELAEGRYESALRRFRQALQLDPNYAEAHNGLGVVYGQLKRFPDAVIAFHAAMATGPASAHVLNNLGFAQLHAGQLHDAWESFERSLALDPTNERTQQNVALLAQAQRDAGRTTVAAADRTAAVAADPRVSAAPASANAADTSTPAASPSREPELRFLPAQAREMPAAVEAAKVEPVRVPDVVVADQYAGVRYEPVAFSKSTFAPQHDSASAIDAAASTAKEAAAAAPVGSARSDAYEVVLSKSGASTLVQLAPSVYELRSNDDAQPVTASASSQKATPPVTAREPAAAVVSSKPAQQADESDVARSPSISFAAVDGIHAVEISNAVGIRKLAQRTAQKLSQQGVTVTRLSDHGSFGLDRSEIHYRDGHVAGATELLAKLPLDARLVRSAELRDGVNVRLVVGRDLAVDERGWYADISKAAANGAVESGTLAAARTGAGTQAAPANREAGSIVAVDGLEVSNAVGIRHLARRTAQKLSVLGAEIARLSDYWSFGKQQTEIHYRSGHLAGARAVQNRLPVEAKLVQTNRLHAEVKVRLVVGRDMVTGSVAWYDSEPEVARASPGAGTAAPVTAFDASTTAFDASTTAFDASTTAVDIRAATDRVAQSHVTDGWRHL